MILFVGIVLLNSSHIVIGNASSDESFVAVKATNMEDAREKVQHYAASCIGE